MNISRIEQLKAFLDEDPNDPFNYYALALEHSKYNTDSALYFYNILLEKFPDYVSTYYHLGKLYQDLEKYTEAENTFLQGISTATRFGKPKDVSELKNTLQQLRDEM